MSRSNFSPGRRRLFAAALGALALAGCASDRPPSSPSPRSASAPPPAPQAARPSAARSSAKASHRSSPRQIWNLRAGLNVAALNCPRHRTLASSYRRLLKRHESLLKASYDSERRKAGGSFDRQQTRLYNHFSLHRSRARFCDTASGLAQRASAMSSDEFSAAASDMLGRLEQARR